MPVWGYVLLTDHAAVARSFPRGPMAVAVGECRYGRTRGVFRWDERLVKSYRMGYKSETRRDRSARARVRPDDGGNQRGAGVDNAGAGAPGSGCVVGDEELGMEVVAVGVLDDCCSPAPLDLSFDGPTLPCLLFCAACLITCVLCLIQSSVGFVILPFSTLLRQESPRTTVTAA